MPGTNAQAQANGATLQRILAGFLALGLILVLISTIRTLRVRAAARFQLPLDVGLRMRAVQCGDCNSPQYMSLSGHIFVCYVCHCANRLRWIEALDPEPPRAAPATPARPLRSYSFKKGGEHFWQELMVEEITDVAQPLDLNVASAPNAASLADEDLAPPFSPAAAAEHDEILPSGNRASEISTGSRPSKNGLPLCAICLDSPGDIVVLPCSHGGLCISCIMKIIENQARGGRHCPHCRGNIRSIVKLREVSGELARGFEIRIPKQSRYSRASTS